MATIKDLITLAEAEVGYLEKKSDLQLDDKTANAGDKNFTKYSRDLVQWIGSPYAQGVAWCDQFFDWLIIKVFGKEKAKELLGGWSAYTPTSAQYYQNMKRWYTSNPQVGDQIFFKNSSRICHTGLVYKVDASKVYTIEGNTSSASGVVANGGAVAKKSYPLNYAKIAGYGRPDYPKDGVKIEEPKKATTLSYPCRGIDISKYQKGLNYEALKQNGCQFSIIKIVDKQLQKEPEFETHYNGCVNAGISVLGVYQYSYAQTIEKARIDAQAVIKALNGRKVPVVIDIEDNCQKNLGHLLVDIINAYQDVIEAAGLSFYIYSGYSFVKSYIVPYLKDLKCKNFWIARYYKSSTPMGITEQLDDSKIPTVQGINLIGWQFTSNGIVAGSQGRLDCNIFYQKPNSTSASIPIQKQGVVTANTLNVREKPNTTSKILGYLKKSEVISISKIDLATGWYKVGDGWVSNKYIQIL